MRPNVLGAKGANRNHEKTFRRMTTEVLARTEQYHRDMAAEHLKIAEIAARVQIEKRGAGNGHDTANGQVRESSRP